MKNSRTGREEGIPHGGRHHNFLWRLHRGEVPSTGLGYLHDKLIR